MFLYLIGGTVYYEKVYQATSTDIVYRSSHTLISVVDFALALWLSIVAIRKIIAAYRQQSTSSHHRAVHAAYP